MPISSWPGLSRPSTSLLRTPPHKQGVDARHKVGYDDQTESPLMDSINSEVPAAPAPVIRTEPPPRVWKFWGTALWGLFIFAAMFVGQIGVVAWFVLRREGPGATASPIPLALRRHHSVVAGVVGAGSAIRLVLFRRGVFNRPPARVSPLSLQFDLADGGCARPQQSGRGGADHLAHRVIPGVSNDVSAFRGFLS